MLVINICKVYVLKYIYIYIYIYIDTLIEKKNINKNELAYSLQFVFFIRDI